MVSNNPATQCECLNQILHRRPAPSLPTHASIKLLYNSFSRNFTDKISLVQSTFIGHILDTVNADSPPLNVQVASFEPATTTEVRKNNHVPT